MVNGFKQENIIKYLLTCRNKYVAHLEQSSKPPDTYRILESNLEKIIKDIKEMIEEYSRIDVFLA
jgi:hypothetical protein